jgi:hypothetical protein
MSLNRILAKGASRGRSNLALVFRKNFLVETTVYGSRLCARKTGCSLVYERMSRRAAVIAQAEVARVVRAAKQAGAATVEVRPDGTIIVHISAPPIAPDLDDDLPPVIL